MTSEPTDKTLDEDAVLSLPADLIATPSSRLNKGWVYRDQIQSNTAGSTVLAFYTSRYTHSSPKAWQQRLTKGQIALDGIPTQADTRLKAGQCLTYHRPPWHEPPVPRWFNVIWEDRDLLIITKPSGLPVLPGGQFLENTLLGLLREAYPEDQHLTPVHRLGRGTSGLMAIARSLRARQDLAQAWRQGNVLKIYRALAQTTDMPASFVMDTPIGKVAYAPLGQIYAASPSGKAAHSIARVLERRVDPSSSLLELEIATGRPHQIRIHLAAAGYPLLGDPLYAKGGLPNPVQANGPHAVPGDGGYLLHAHRLTFKHPQTGMLQEFIGEPPEALKQQKREKTKKHPS